MGAFNEKRDRQTTTGWRMGGLPFWGTALLVFITLAMPGVATALNISDVPLFLSTQAPPNIMLILDNSGSMQNVVPDAPYAPGATYDCTPAGNVLSTAYKVDLFITSGGLPYFRRGSSGSTYFDWGTGSGNGATGRAKRCFDPNASYLARLYGDRGGATASKNPGSYLPAQYTGHFLNWYFGTTTSNVYGTQAAGFGSQARIKPGVQTRMAIAKGAAKGLVDSQSGVRMGLATYNTVTSGDGGSLLEIVGDLDSGKKTAIKNKIEALAPFGNTPLAEALSDVGRYFTTGCTGSLTLHPGKPESLTATVAQIFNGHSIRDDSGQTITAPIQESCQKSFVVYLTDGRPQGDQSISSHLADYDRDCSGALASQCTSYDRKNDREYESAGSDYLDDVAKALNEMDLRPDLVDPHGVRNNLATYMIGFADDQAMNDPLMQDTAGQGGGIFLIAGNESELVAAFQAAAQNILGKLSSAAAIATNSTRMVDNSLIYQAKFNSANWSGQMIAYQIGTDGTVGNVTWDTDEANKIAAHGTRKIYTFNGSAGVPFAWENLDNSQKLALQSAGTEQQGIDRLHWIRGDQSKEEGESGGYLRPRSKILGDIVNSDPLVVGAANFRYDELPAGTGQDTYAAFRNGNKTRRKMLYTGGNDGLLHAFDALTGEEKFAYLPNGVYGNLAALTHPEYTHKFYVDGSPNAGDAHILGGWKTVLVGTLGAGGRSVFALDVTDPDSFDESKVLWEFTYANVDCDPGVAGCRDLGYTFGQPVVARMENGEWAAIFGNGYGSDTHQAQLFIVNLETGALIRKIDTGAGTLGSPNGLSTPALRANSERTIEYAYAGDLLGNLWKFDLTHSSQPTQWDSAFKAGGPPKPVPLFRALNPSGGAQPITAPLEIGSHPEGGYMLYFGTGKYFESGDNQVGTPQVQSFYGIWDKSDANNSHITEPYRSKLQGQTILAEGQLHPESGNLLRAVSANPIDWEQKRGWYLDLLSPVAGVEGERVVSAPLLRHGRVIFTTLIPSEEPCEAGGTSWLMELDAVTGNRPGYSVLDVDEDGTIGNDDTVIIVIGEEEVEVSVSGIQSEVGIIKTPAVVKKDDVEFKFSAGSEGGISVIREEAGNSDRFGRRSWRQLR